MKPRYGAEDRDGIDFLDTFPGLPPYPARPLPDHVRQPAVDDPAVCRLLDGRGFERLLPPQPRGRAEGPLGRLRSRDPPRLRLATIRASPATSAWPASRSNSIYDMRTLFAGIPLDEMSVSMTMNGAVLPVLALYIVAAEEQGVPPEKLAGTIQNDILKEFMVRNTYIYPPGALDADHLRHLRLHVGATCRSSTRSRSPAITCRRRARRRTSSSPTRSPTASNTCAPASAPGLTIDQFAPRLSFFWAIGMNFFMEVAKLRAARLLWAKLVKALRRRRTTSRCRCAPIARPRAGRSPRRTSSTTSRAPTIEAMAATQGGTQSLHTNALDEALALPTDFSARIARNTQLFLQQESGTTRIIDPWGGSYYVERLTARACAQRPGRTSRRSKRSAAWPRRSRPASRSCASRRPPPARRRASTPARRRSSASTSYRRADERADRQS